ncbi:Uncharacterised protein [Mycobacteroides abscessus subsp. abscessus]|nr:Uncharacterised protein [Mycobacteroides abscessus subsp. abscessus]
MKQAVITTVSDFTWVGPDGDFIDGDVNWSRAAASLIASLGLRHETVRVGELRGTLIVSGVDVQEETGE